MWSHVESGKDSMAGSWAGGSNSDLTLSFSQPPKESDIVPWPIGEGREVSK